jgi:hypothetical protein
MDMRLGTRNAHDDFLDGAVPWRLAVGMIKNLMGDLQCDEP